MIYLDSAATTLQKPPEVARASAWAICHLASPGRGGHRPAMAAADTAFACREEAAALFDVPEPEQVVFTFNATHGLNLAIKSLVRPGDTVVVSGYEHNAVTRPLRAIPGVTVRVADSPLFDRAAALEAFRRALTPEVRAAVCTHVSNVFGFILPIEDIAALCRSRGIPLIVDASQSAGCLPISLRELGAAFIAMPGHKGLYGPQGTGLLEGLRFLRRREQAGLAVREEKLIRRLGEGLSRLPGTEVYLAPRDSGAQSGVLSFRVQDRDCEELGELLGRRGIALRAGLHCAPLAHRTAGTLESGTLRASVSAFTLPEEIGRALAITEELLREEAV